MDTAALLLVCLASASLGHRFELPSEPSSDAELEKSHKASDVAKWLSPERRDDGFHVAHALARLLWVSKAPAAGWHTNGHGCLPVMGCHGVGQRARTLLATSHPSSPGLSRRAALLGLAAATSLPAAAPARPEGVNKPELLPSYQTNVIDLQKVLTSGQLKKLDQKLTKLQEKTNFKLRVLTQQYPETPGLAIKDYWGVDDQTIVLVVDRGGLKKDRLANILNFNVGQGASLALPNSFWTRLKNTFGNVQYVKDNGEDNAVLTALDTIDYCLRNEEEGCTDVPMMFKDPSRAFGDKDSVKANEDEIKNAFDALRGKKKQSADPLDFPKF